MARCLAKFHQVATGVLFTRIKTLFTLQISKHSLHAIVKKPAEFQLWYLVLLFWI